MKSGHWAIPRPWSVASRRQALLLLFFEGWNSIALGLPWCAAFYQWRSKYGGMDASLISEMKQLQAENARLKRMYADIAMQNELVKEALVKK
jgi:hypothetical protein